MQEVCRNHDRLDSCCSNGRRCECYYGYVCTLTEYLLASSTICLTQTTVYVCIWLRFRLNWSSNIYYSSSYRVPWNNNALLFMLVFVFHRYKSCFIVYVITYCIKTYIDNSNLCTMELKCLMELNGVPINESETGKKIKEYS